jgi:proline iminopeptidase
VGSATPADPTSYRCERLVDDVDAVTELLGLDQVDLLAHSAGAILALLYAARQPHRVDKLVLVTPSTFAVGITATGESRLEA